MVDNGVFFLKNYRNNVETRAKIQLFFEKIGVGGRYQTRLFLPRDSGIRLPIFIRLSCLHLDNDQFLALLGDDINLLMDIVPVAIHNLIASPYEIMSGYLLSDLP